MILLISVAALLFAIFPLTDTDIWWHLVCAREWVTTWTPVREPIVNVHEYFQLVMRLVFECGGAFGDAGDGALSRDALNCGAGALVVFKAVLWGSVFALFLWPAHREFRAFSMRSPSRLRSMWLLRLWFLFGATLLLFIFRFQLEMRPVVFSLLFLGVYWNVLPPLFARRWSGRKSLAIAVAILVVQWLWCKCQGLYILGPLFALLACAMARANASRVADARCDVAGVDAGCRVVAAVECDCADAAADCGLFVEGVAQKNAAADCRSVTDAKSRIANAKCDVAVANAECCHANAPQSLSWRSVAEIAFVVLLFLMPFLHREGVDLLLYPFGLLNRLLGMSPSAAIFATEIAENRSPISLVLSGENLLSSMVAACLCIAFLATFAVAAVKFRDHLKSSCLMNVRVVWLLLMCILALVAERNWVLFMPPALCVTLCALLKSRTHLCTLLRTHLLAHSNIETEHPHRMLILAPIFGLSLMLGFWCKSLLAYDSAVAYQRVPVNAAEWMLEHPHGGRLFNDDRAGGYLALVNPSDSIYIDGRFILKTADFFERYLRYAQEPELFMHDADSLNVDRAIFPLRYYARWNEVLDSLAHAENWHLVYRDDFFAVMDRTLNVKNFAK